MYVRDTDADFFTTRPLRLQYGPRWRWRLWQSYASRNLQVPGDDHWLCRLSEYLRLLSQDQDLERTGQVTGDIAPAVSLDLNSAKSAKLKILTLAAVPLEEIKSRLGLELAALQAWEALFFDVRRMLDDASWLAHHVIEPEQVAGNPQLASQMKLAVISKAAAVRVLFQAEDLAPLKAADRLFGQRVRLADQAQKLSTMPFDELPDAIKYLTKFNRWRQQEQQLKVDDQRLSDRCHESVRKRELSSANRRRKKQSSQQHSVSEAIENPAAFEPQAVAKG